MKALFHKICILKKKSKCFFTSFIYVTNTYTQLFCFLTNKLAIEFMFGNALNFQPTLTIPKQRKRGLYLNIVSTMLMKFKWETHIISDWISTLQLSTGNEFLFKNILRCGVYVNLTAKCFHNFRHILPPIVWRWLTKVEEIVGVISKPINLIIYFAEMRKT